MRKMPYKDPKKQRKAMRKISRDYRERQRIKLARLKNNDRRMRQVAHDSRVNARAPRDRYSHRLTVGKAEKKKAAKDANK